MLFTDQWLSPIASVARHVFALRTAMPSSWESFGAPSALTEILVARLQAMKWGECEEAHAAPRKDTQPPIGVLTTAP